MDNGNGVHTKPIHVYLLTELEGRTGRYLARGVGVRGPSAKYFPILPDLTQSLSILTYDHCAFPFFFFGL